MAELITTEMGSPISFSRLAQGPAPWCRARRPSPMPPASSGRRSAPAPSADVIVRREPVGVVAAIVPWNVPQFTIMSKLGPALVAGCTIV